MMTALASKWVRVISQSVRNSSILGVVFTKSRSFCKDRKHNYDQAKRAMHILYIRIPIGLKLQLFELLFYQLSNMDVISGRLKILIL